MVVSNHLSFQQTFTGPFVYWIKPVLPQTLLKGILESIGYHPETDMEYRLDKSADPEKATRMGFELFLARQECEYLLEVMQNRPWDCLEILQQRSPQTRKSLGEANEHAQEDKAEKSTPAESENVLLQDNREEDLDRGRSLVDPGAVPSEECQTFPGTAGGEDEDLEQHPRSLEFQAPDEPVEPGGGQSRGLMTDDRSILEMRERYPDLAFQKKFLFGELQGQPAGQSRQKTPKTVAVAGSELSVPSSTARLPESRPVTSVTVVSPKLTRHPPEVQALEKDPVETHHAQMPAPLQGSGPRGAQTMPENNQGDESIVSELSEKMGQMSVKDYHADMDLKYPVEETAWQDDGKATPLGSPRDGSKPIVCHPSQVPHGPISTCCTCEFSNTPRGDSTGCNTIKEPPQSFYIPAMCAPPPSRGHTLQPEEEMLETYVLVEHDQK